ncbi:hypothetical protein BX589_101255 [Paraburkholderia fungorum]|nr:hypothetical protein BX589_101255 [Paraburkholderia fungorum]
MSDALLLTDWKREFGPVLGPIVGPQMFARDCSGCEAFDRYTSVRWNGALAIHPLLNSRRLDADRTRKRRVPAQEFAGPQDSVRRGITHEAHYMALPHLCKALPHVPMYGSN